MSRLVEIRKKSPIITSVIFTVILVVLLMGLQYLLTFLMLFSPDFMDFATENAFLIQLIIEALFFVLAIVGMKLFGKEDMFTYRRVGFFKGLVPGMYFIFAPLVTLVSSMAPMLTSSEPVSFKSPFQIISWVVCVFAIGLAEEMFCRGIIGGMIFEKYATDAVGVWFSVIMTSFVFSLLHLTNLTSADPAGVIVQVVANLVQGMLLTAIYFRSQNLWSVIFIHAWLDMIGTATAGLFNTGASVEGIISGYRPMMLMGIPVQIGITCLILRNSKIREMLGQQDIKGTPESKKRFRIVVIIAGVILGAAIIWGITDYVNYIFENIMPSVSEAAKSLGNLKDILK